MRVAVDPTTLDPAGDVEFVAAIDNADDFCLDEVLVGPSSAAWGRDPGPRHGY
jgi:hypothetical protein